MSQVPNNPCYLWLLHCSAQRTFPSSQDLLFEEHCSREKGQKVWVLRVQKRRGFPEDTFELELKGEGKCSGGEGWGRQEHILGKENSTHKTCAGRDPSDRNAKRGGRVINSRVSKGLAAWVWIPDLTLPSCVLLDKCLNFSVPHFLTCKVRIIIAPPSKGCGEEWKSQAQV